MAQIQSASISGNILTITYDEAMTLINPGSIFSSSGDFVDVIGLTGDNTNVWTLTLGATITPTDYILMESNGQNAIGVTSQQYLEHGNLYIGGSGNTVLDVAGGDWEHTMVVGNEGEDTISVDGTAFIDLHETSPASDTVRVAGYYYDEHQDVFIAGFDVSGTTTNDKLSLLSGTIAGDASNVDGVDVGTIAAHSISNGIVTFKNTGGGDIVVDTEEEYDNVVQYLDTNIALSGTTLAFRGIGDDGEGMVVYQKGVYGRDTTTIVELNGLSGVTLSNTGGTNVVQIVDTQAPIVGNGSMTTTGVNLYLTETVTAVQTTGMKLYKNGTADMGALSQTINGATVRLDSSTHTLSATDFVVLDTVLTAGSYTATDGFGNTGSFFCDDDEDFYSSFRVAIGGNGDNTINLSLLTGVTEADGKGGADIITGSKYDDDIDGGDGNDLLSGGFGDDWLGGGNGNDTLRGGFGNDELDGDAGNDILDGGAGGDYMNGGAGNDTYVVDSWDDYCHEDDSDILTGGNDTVKSYLSDGFLDWNIENLHIMRTIGGNAYGNELDNTIFAGVGDNSMYGFDGVDTLSYANATAGVTVSLNADNTPQATGGSGIDTISEFENLTGSGFADTLTGSDGANILNGGSGIDTMIGGLGNDTYVVNHASDIVTELAGEGIDTIKSSVTYSLVDTDGAGSNGGNVEKLTLTGTLAINGTGNSLANTLLGNTAANTLNGGSGNDTLNGGGGNDTLNGGAGKDTLTGGAGNDFFIFNSALNATTNKDTIVDFNVINDTIKLENGIFTALTTTGTLNSDFFSNTGVATDSNDYIIYNPTSGALFYDADGNAGGAAVQFALLGTTTHPTITNADFVVY